jgi:chitin disaccharide deacetylase
VSEWGVHPGLGTPELQALEPESWQVRQTDFDFLMSEQARQIIEQEGIVLLSYQPLQKVWLKLCSSST